MRARQRPADVSGRSGAGAGPVAADHRCLCTRCGAAGGLEAAAVGNRG